MWSQSKPATTVQGSAGRDRGVYLNLHVSCVNRRAGNLWVRMEALARRIHLHPLRTYTQCVCYGRNVGASHQPGSFYWAQSPGLDCLLITGSLRRAWYQATCCSAMARHTTSGPPPTRRTRISHSENPYPADKHYPLLLSPVQMQMASLTPHVALALSLDLNGLGSAYLPCLFIAGGLVTGILSAIVTSSSSSRHMAWIAMFLRLIGACAPFAHFCQVSFTRGFRYTYFPICLKENPVCTASLLEHTTHPLHSTWNSCSIS